MFSLNGHALRCAFFSARNHRNEHNAVHVSFGGKTFSFNFRTFAQEYFLLDPVAREITHNCTNHGNLETLGRQNVLAFTPVASWKCVPCPMSITETGSMESPQWFDAPGEQHRHSDRFFSGRLRDAEAFSLFFTTNRKIYDPWRKTIEIPAGKIKYMNSYIDSLNFVGAIGF